METLRDLRPFSLRRGCDLVSPVDGFLVPVPELGPYDRSAAFMKIAESTSEILAGGHAPLVLGGDQIVEMASGKVGAHGAVEPAPSERPGDEEADFTRSSPVRREYFAWRSASANGTVRDQQLAEDRLRSLLDDAVAGPGEGPAYCLVSGGIDSNVVASLANRQRSEIHLLSVGTARANAFSNASEVGARLGKPVREILVSEDHYETTPATNLRSHIEHL